MSSLPRTSPAPDVVRARRAVGALFLTNGAIFANLVPRYPEIKAGLELSDAVYGLAIAAFPTGAILAGLAAAPLVRRFGSGRLAVAGTVLTGLGVLAAGLAPGFWTFALALLCGGAADAVTDVAQNAHGLRVQRRFGRSILNSFHALWSVGAVLGGLMAAGAIVLGLPLGVHLSVSAVIFAVVAVLAGRACLPGLDSEDAEARPAAAAAGEVVARAGARTAWLLVALTLLAMSGTLVEDAGSTWATLYLGRNLGAPEALAATGFVALVGAQFVGRMLGDGFVDRFGQRAVARTGGVLVAAGMGLALAWPTVPGTICGFAAAGFGVATLVPAAMHAADELPGLKPGTGLTVVSWLMRLSFLLSPPIVGAVADATSLRAALVVVPLAGLAVVVLASVLSGRPGRG